MAQDPEIPTEPAPPPPAPQRRRMSPALRVGLAATAGLAVLAGAFLFVDRTPPAPSDIRRAPDLSAVPGGQVQEESPRYQEVLRQSNDARAEEALRRGETWVATPESILRRLEALELDRDRAEAPAPDDPIVPVEEAAPPPPPAPAPVYEPAPRQVARGAGAPDEAITGLADAMLAQMGAISDASLPPVGMGVIDIARPQAAPAEGEGGAGDAGGPAPEPAGETLARAGDILYGQTLTRASSDVPGPVLVEIVSGPLKGARLVGAFETVPAVDRLVVSFSSLSLPDGRSAPITAFAVDGRSAEISVASDVNRRYLSRYGPILAASFLSGYAAAAAAVEEQILVLGDGTQIVASSRSDLEQNLYAGAASAVEAIAGDLVSNAPKGPEITLRDGWPVGILFLADVIVQEGSR